MQPVRIIGGMEVKEVCILTFLGINAWLDIKKQEISLITVGLFSAVGFLWLFYNEGSLLEIVVPLAVGALFLALSIAARGAIGMGDSWMLMSLGPWLGTEGFLWTLCIGMLLAGGWSLILLAILKKNRHTEIPFVPFLLTGYVGGLILW